MVKMEKQGLFDGAGSEGNNEGIGIKKGYNCARFYKISDGRYTNGIASECNKNQSIYDDVGLIKNKGLHCGAGAEADGFTHLKRKCFINPCLFGKLPNYEKAVINVDKIERYALYQKDKAIAFKEALGYTIQNAKDLIENIKKNLGNFEAKEEDENSYGKRYSVLMELKGPNGKTAKVKTGWIEDKKTGEMRLTTAFIDK